MLGTSLDNALFLFKSKIVADSENCGFVTSLCPDFRLWPGLYDIYLCLRPKNWSVM